MTTPTIDTLKAKARKLADHRPGSFGYEIEYLIGSAEDNANDTCFVEKTCTEDEWNAVFMGSLEMLLGSTRDKRVCAWFHKQGVRW